MITYNSKFKKTPSRDSGKPQSRYSLREEEDALFDDTPIDYDDDVAAPVTQSLSESDVSEILEMLKNIDRRLAKLEEILGESKRREFSSTIKDLSGMNESADIHRPPKGSMLAEIQNTLESQGFNSGAMSENFQPTQVSTQGVLPPDFYDDQI